MNKERPYRLERRRYEMQRITAFAAIMRVVLTSVSIPTVFKSELRDASSLENLDLPPA
jgi:hypothetical protein